MNEEMCSEVTELNITDCEKFYMDNSIWIKKSIYIYILYNIIQGYI